jgi:hypothetical protein
MKKQRPKVSWYCPFKGAVYQHVQSVLFQPDNGIFLPRGSTHVWLFELLKGQCY